ncbi:hypothetical protein COLO4_12859 [Corchorus olitorius]|uniref:Uncharacterized protein n=1 Tax=Corchorus olitorius TaxID=93759 RepID=A0A1R3JZB5_9ROSI|nr:hypothetical protein COLO4_12859 [Corchorus olitorius]
MGKIPAVNCCILFCMDCKPTKAGVYVAERQAFCCVSYVPKYQILTLFFFRSLISAAHFPHGLCLTILPIMLAMQPFSSTRHRFNLYFNRLLLIG